MLKAASHGIRQDVRESDLACRFGGEEMVVILPECSREATAERDENLRQAIAR